MDVSVYGETQRKQKPKKAPTMRPQTPSSPSIGQKRQREDPQPQPQAQEQTPAAAAAPKTKTCQCGSRVSDAEVRESRWTLGTGLSVTLCSNCPHQK
jgi:hypothetical protein